MVALRTRPGGVRNLAPFGLAALFFVFGSARIGHQDIAEAGRQAVVRDAARDHVLASPFSTARAGVFTLSYGLAAATAERQFVRLASIASDDLLTGMIPRDLREAERRDDSGSRVNRAAKGDLLVPRVQIELSTQREEPQEPADSEIAAALRYEPFPEYDISLSLELDPQLPSEPQEEPAVADAWGENPSFDPVATFGRKRILFGAGPLGPTIGQIEPWQTGEAPIVVIPAAPKQALATLSDEKMKALPRHGDEGMTVAGKGEVTGEGRHPKSPAEMLELGGKSRAKAEKCLANAVYFESRGEPVRGQIAVAQVVLNRALSGYYPEDVCGVVYQNAHRHLACQFTFACDGIRDAVNDQEAWDRATRVARAALDGEVWLNEVGKATHYHASWVRPWWVRTMRKLTRIGVHTFYRPRRWGNGADEPVWRDLAMTELAAKL